MTDYNLLSKQLEALAESSVNYLPLLSNCSALIYENLKDLNWAGFYLVKDEALLLGPFQGKTACVNIPKGKGVCGTAYEKDEIQLVDNVHEFPGHIACDSASNSEIVIPIHKDGKVVAVLDIDSPSYSRFSPEDKEGLEKLVKKLEELIDWGNWR
ncbi:MAG: GAF domain-containing protein [Erysipelotrichaceae bacterium]|nr:GAF domain-containing protein [Erysipelotrichaceae bacterium]